MKNTVKDTLTYICKFTSDLDRNEWDDYENAYFSGGGDTKERREFFRNLYRNNPYGDSIHVIVYMNSKPMATNGHLRSDIDSGSKSFMSLHTYVSPVLRGQGVFSKISRLCVEKSSPNYIFGFPNENSYPGFIKFGWKVRDIGISSQYVGFGSKVLDAHTRRGSIPDEFVGWRFSSRPSEFRIFSKSGYYLLLRRQLYKGLIIHKALGLVSSDSARHFEEVTPLGIVSYVDGSGLGLIKKSTAVIIENTSYATSKASIPIWQSDVF